MPAITPLDAWIARRISQDRGQMQHPGLEQNPEMAAPLDRNTLEAYQRDALNQTVAYARNTSPFYRDHLASLPETPLAGLDDLARLPFTTAADLHQGSMRFLCVSQSLAPHVVSLNTSGTTGQPKRLFFSEEDLERTVDFFHHGMSTFVSHGQRVLTLMPGARASSVGGLLTSALARLNVTNFVHGFVADPQAASREIADKSIDCLVGLPSQVLALARHMEAEGTCAACRISSVLLSGDHAPAIMMEEIARIWGCRVFTHYGLTETGLGGGVECATRDGCHLREVDLLFEIVDPVTGAAFPDGVPGEVVVTTLNREAMPLIRYRTGDLARFLPGRCPCGTTLRRLSRIDGRINEPVRLPQGGRLSVRHLDQALLPLSGLLHYRAHLHRKTLLLTLYATQGTEPGILSSRAMEAVATALAQQPEAAPAERKTQSVGFPAESLRLETQVLAAWPWASQGPMKSRIVVSEANQ